jgi:hypothetical protein
VAVAGGLLEEAAEGEHRAPQQGAGVTAELALEAEYVVVGGHDENRIAP